MPEEEKKRKEEGRGLSVPNGDRGRKRRSPRKFLNQVGKSLFKKKGERGNMAARRFAVSEEKTKTNGLLASSKKKERGAKPLGRNDRKGGGLKNPSFSSGSPLPSKELRRKRKRIWNLKGMEVGWAPRKNVFPRLFPWIFLFARKHWRKPSKDFAFFGSMHGPFLASPLKIQCR